MDLLGPVTRVKKKKKKKWFSDEPSSPAVTAAFVGEVRPRTTTLHKCAVVPRRARI